MAVYENSFHIFNCAGKINIFAYNLMAHRKEI